MKYDFEHHPEHKAQLDFWRDQWISIALRTAAQTDADKEACRIAMRGMYSAAELPVPTREIFVSSPLVGAVAWVAASCAWWIRRNPDRHLELFGSHVTESEIMHGMREGVALAIKRGIAALDGTQAAATHVATHVATRDATYATRAATRDATEAATYSATDAATHAATDAATYSAAHDATRAATGAATHVATYSATHAATRDATDAATYAAIAAFVLAAMPRWGRGWNGGNHWAGWVAYLSFFRHVAKLGLPEYERYQHYESAAIHGSHRFLHSDFWIVSDFPTVVGRDDENRSHSAVGPALAWRDGVSVWNFHGVSVPRSWIEHPESIPIEAAINDPNMERRAAAASILGWDKVLQRLNPRVINEDANPQIGTLLEVDLPASPATRFLRVFDPCGARTHVILVPSECKTALEAQLLTYGIDEETFNMIEVRT